MRRRVSRRVSWRGGRGLSVGGFNLGGVIIPGAATQAPCEGAAPAEEIPVQEARERLTRMKLVAPGELAGQRPGIDEWDSNGHGLDGHGLDGPAGGRRPGLELRGWGGPDLRGGAGLGRLG